MSPQIASAVWGFFFFEYGYKLTEDRALECMMVNGDTIVRPNMDALGRNIGKSIGKKYEVNGESHEDTVAEEKISYVKFGDHATNLPSNVRFATNGVFRESMQYKYDSMGNIVEVSENGRTVCRYEYDALGRLTREDSVAFGKTSTWAYDNNGNILTRYEYPLTFVKTEDLQILDCDAFDYDYDDHSDQLMSYNGEAFVYDTMGNPTTYRGKTAVWEYGRQLKSYDGNTFAYDARGRRTGKNNITFTYDSNGNLIKQSNGLEFFYDHTGVFAVKYNGSTYFYRKNVQQDVIALLDNNGNVMVKYTYDAWGKCQTTVVDSTATEIATLNPFRYRSYYFDTETGFYFLKTRYYDPEIGRFITIDDLSYLDPESINGLNLYAYCLNNPLRYIDKTGTSVLLAVAALFLSTHIGGLVFQTITSILCYGIIAVASLFNETIRNDMNAIGWNPFNSNSATASSANIVSFYKGVPVFMNDIDIFEASFSFGIIAIDKDSHYGEEHILKHERGHSTQLMTMGPLKYFLLIGIPSMLKNDKYAPWELSASILGNSSYGAEDATISQKQTATAYYRTANTNVPLFWVYNIYHMITAK